MLSLGKGVIWKAAHTDVPIPNTGLVHKEVIKALSICLSIFSQDKTAFREVISQLEMDPKCKGLPFSSFLILPFQRITRLKLLVQVQLLSAVF